MEEALAARFLRLKRIMDELRERCPWDRKQTVHSLRQLTLEETYELAEAITAGDWQGIREELGDLMLHILFYARIGGEEGRFTLDEVLDGISDKLIARHPHVYGDVKAEDEEAVKRNWERLKIGEGKSSALDGLPASLPALVKAMRLQEKARQTGFDWEAAGQVWAKVEEELGEFKEAREMADARGGDPADGQGEVEQEFGDLLFSLVNYARFIGIDPENALERTNRKFIHRFRRMEEQAKAQGLRLTDMSLSEMDAIWDAVKREGDA